MPARTLLALALSVPKMGNLFGKYIEIPLNNWVYQLTSFPKCVYFANSQLQWQRQLHIVLTRGIDSADLHSLQSSWRMQIAVHGSRVLSPWDDCDGWNHFRITFVYSFRLAWSILVYCNQRMAIEYIFYILKYVFIYRIDWIILIKIYLIIFKSFYEFI